MTIPTGIRMIRLNPGGSSPSPLVSKRIIMPAIPRTGIGPRSAVKERGPNCCTISADAGQMENLRKRTSCAQSGRCPVYAISGCRPRRARYRRISLQSARSMRFLPTPGPPPSLLQGAIEVVELTSVRFSIRWKNAGKNCDLRRREVRSEFPSGVTNSRSISACRNSVRW